MGWIGLMPSHRVNDNAIDAMVGPQMIARSRNRAIPIRTTSTSQSRVVKRWNRRRRQPRRPASGGLVGGAAGSVRVAGIVTTTLSVLRVDRLLLCLDVLQDAIDVVRVVEEGVQRRDHDVLREVR